VRRVEGDQAQIGIKCANWGGSRLNNVAVAAQFGGALDDLMLEHILQLTQLGLCPRALDRRLDPLAYLLNEAFLGGGPGARRSTLNRQQADPLLLLEKHHVDKGADISCQKSRPCAVAEPFIRADVAHDDRFAAAIGGE
jgi:hypothetical protein